MIICGLDPGSINSGVAVFDADELVYFEHVKLPVTPSNPRAWWMRRFLDLLRTYRAEMIAFEDYLWQGPALTAENSPDQWKMCGLIESLEALCPYPQIFPFASQHWKSELTGNPGATKTECARTVEMRLGCEIVQQITTHGGGHVSDAIGVAMVLRDYAVQAEAGNVTLAKFHAIKASEWRHAEKQRLRSRKGVKRYARGR